MVCTCTTPKLVLCSRRSSVSLTTRGDFRRGCSSRRSTLAAVETDPISRGRVNAPVVNVVDDRSIDVVHGAVVVKTHRDSNILPDSRSRCIRNHNRFRRRTQHSGPRSLHATSMHRHSNPSSPESTMLRRTEATPKFQAPSSSRNRHMPNSQEPRCTRPRDRSAARRQAAPAARS